MVLGNVRDAIAFACEAQRDWVLFIPKCEQDRMARWLSDNPGGKYDEYKRMRDGF